MEPLLLRARSRTDGAVYEVVVRLERAPDGPAAFRGLVARLEVRGQRGQPCN